MSKRKVFKFARILFNWGITTSGVTDERRGGQGANAPLAAPMWAPFFRNGPPSASFAS